MTTITKNQYNMLIGLILLAEQHMDQLAAVERAACELVGQQNRGAVHEHIHWPTEVSVDELLDSMGITVG